MHLYLLIGVSHWLLHAEAIINEKTPTNREIHKRSTQKTRTIKQERKSNTIFNEVQQFAYVLRAREREKDLIDSIINYKLQFMGYTP